MSDDLNTQSLDDTILETLRDIEARGDMPADEPKDEPKEEAKPAEEAPKKAERARDESGRFAPKAEAPAEPAAEPEQKAEPAEPKEPARRPKWAKDALEQFDTLPEQVKAAALKREEDMHRGLDMYRESAKFGEAIKQTLGQRAQILQATYGSVEAGLQALFQLSDHAAQDPAGFVRRLAQARGIDLAALASGEQQQALPPESTSVQQRMQHLESLLQQQQQSQQQAVLASLNSDLARFAEEHDKPGYMNDWIEGPAGPVPGPFRQRMASLLESGAAATLQDAYEMAVWTNPTLRQARLAQQQAADKAAADKARVIESAKKAQGINVRRVGTLPAVEQSSGSMDDTIRDAYRRLTA